MSQLTPAPSGAKGRDFVLGDEVRVRILTSGAETEGRHDFLDCVQQAGAATPLHLHTRYEERLFLVAGSLTVWAGEQTVTLGPGDFYTIPTDTPHAIKAGPDGSRAILVTSPAGFGELIARTATPAHLATPDTEIDHELFMTVTTELGGRVLGPPGQTPEDLAGGKSPA
jgi:mannose-6-phosphate isomerase-like protein (cupin superfamily)